MLQLMVKDKLFLFLNKNAGLSDTQLDTLLSYLVVTKEGGKLAKMIEKRDGSRVSKGAFLRTLNQARVNVRSSLYSVLLLGYLGLLDKRNIEDLVKIVGLLSELKDSGVIIELDRIQSVIEDVCDRLLWM